MHESRGARVGCTRVEVHEMGARVRVIHELGAQDGCTRVEVHEMGARE